MESRGGLANVGGRHAERERELQGWDFRLIAVVAVFADVVERVLYPLAPDFIELQIGFDCVHHVESGRQPGFERSLEKQGGRESVQRPNVRLVDVLHAPRASFAPFGGQVGVGRGGFELVADALAQLGRRRFREGDGGYPVKRRRPRLNERHDSGYEACRLPRSRARFDEQGFVKRFGYALSRRFVARREFRHLEIARLYSSSSSEIRSKYPATILSPLLRSQATSRRDGHRESKSQNRQFS